MIRLLFLSCMLLLVLTGATTGPDKKYLNVFLDAYSADLYQLKKYKREKSQPVFSSSRKNPFSLELTYKVYKTVTTDEARALIIEAVDDILDAINRDGYLIDKVLFQPLTEQQLTFTIKFEGDFTKYLSPVFPKSVKFDKNTVIYTYPSPRLSGRRYDCKVVKEDALYSRMLLNESIDLKKYQQYPYSSSQEASEKSNEPSDAVKVSDPAINDAVESAGASSNEQTILQQSETTPDQSRSVDLLKADSSNTEQSPEILDQSLEDLNQPLKSTEENTQDIDLPTENSSEEAAPSTEVDSQNGVKDSPDSLEEAEKIPEDAFKDDSTQKPAVIDKAEEIEAEISDSEQESSKENDSNEQSMVLRDEDSSNHSEEVEENTSSESFLPSTPSYSDDKQHVGSVQKEEPLSQDISPLDAVKLLVKMQKRELDLIQALQKNIQTESTNQNLFTDEEEEGTTPKDNFFSDPGVRIDSEQLIEEASNDQVDESAASQDLPSSFEGVNTDSSLNNELVVSDSDESSPSQLGNGNEESTAWFIEEAVTPEEVTPSDQEDRIFLDSQEDLNSLKEQSPNEQEKIGSRTDEDQQEEKNLDSIDTTDTKQEDISPQNIESAPKEATESDTSRENGSYIPSLQPQDEQILNNMEEREKSILGSYINQLKTAFQTLADLSIFKSNSKEELSTESFQGQLCDASDDEPQNQKLECAPDLNNGQSSISFVSIEGTSFEVAQDSVEEIEPDAPVQSLEQKEASDNQLEGLKEDSNVLDQNEIDGAHENNVHANVLYPEKEANLQENAAQKFEQILQPKEAHIILSADETARVLISSPRKRFIGEANAIMNHPQIVGLAEGTVQIKNEELSEKTGDDSQVQSELVVDNENHFVENPNDSLTCQEPLNCQSGVEPIVGIKINSEVVLQDSVVELNQISDADNSSKQFEPIVHPKDATILSAREESGSALMRASSKKFMAEMNPETMRSCSTSIAIGALDPNNNTSYHVGAGSIESSDNRDPSLSIDGVQADVNTDGRVAVESVVEIAESAHVNEQTEESVQQDSSTNESLFSQLQSKIEPITSPLVSMVSSMFNGIKSAEGNVREDIVDVNIDEDGSFALSENSQNPPVQAEEDLATIDNIEENSTPLETDPDPTTSSENQQDESAQPDSVMNTSLFSQLQSKIDPILSPVGSFVSSVFNFDSNEENTQSSIAYVETNDESSQDSVEDNQDSLEHSTDDSLSTHINEQNSAQLTVGSDQPSSDKNEQEDPLMSESLFSQFQPASDSVASPLSAMVSSIINNFDHMSKNAPLIAEEESNSVQQYRDDSDQAHLKLQEELQAEDDTTGNSPEDINGDLEHSQKDLLNPTGSQVRQILEDKDNIGDQAISYFPDSNGIQKEFLDIDLEHMPL